MNLLESPCADPLSLYRYRDGLYAVDLLTALMVKFDFFSWLEGRSASEANISDHFGFAARPLDVALTLLAANDLVVRENGVVRATAKAQEHLVAGTGWDIRPYYASLHDRPIARDFAEVLVSGKPAGWSGDKATSDWHKAMEDEDFARKFTAAMDCRGRYLAQALAKALDLSGRRRILDIGGGSGIYACSIVAQHPHLTGCVLEQKPVDHICRTLIQERGFAGKVEVAIGNMFEHMPMDCDVHLFSNVLHDWDLPEVHLLLEASAQALPSGGLLIIHDAFINARKDGPLHVAEYSSLLMHSTQGKCYSTAEYEDLANDHGFDPGAFQETVVARGFMTAVKR
jgi:acetylserotonin N-methyltransferase